MRKKFKSKKRIKINVNTTIFVIVIAIISFLYTFKYFYNKIEFTITNKKYIDYLVSDSLGMYNIGDLTTLSSTDFLLKYSLGIEKIDNLVSNEVLSEVIDEGENVEINTAPIVYLYNSHQTEGYKSSFLESFNINNTVLISSYILKEYLSDLGINSLVEENKIVDILNTNGWKYGASYKASRILMEQAKVNNPSLKYFFDIHRDSSSYQKTVIEINGEKYARVLFVVGLENPNYEKNLKMVERINELIKEYNVSLSRGIMKKEGKGVNGVYNQDFSSHTILIEVGGQYNSIEEVNNTLKILSKVIFEYINEVENG